MVKFSKLLLEDNKVKKAEIYLAQNGRAALYVEDVLKDKYLNLESCLYSNKFLESENVFLLSEYRIQESFEN